DVIGVALERALQGDARAGLVAGAQQLQPQRGRGLEVVRIDRDRALREVRGLDVVVVVRGDLRGKAIHLRIARIDLQDVGDLRVEVGLAVLEQGNRRIGGACVQAVGVTCQRVAARLLRV